MPLKVIVVGAGIAGLCAATALRQAGHDVEVRVKKIHNTLILACYCSIQLIATVSLCSLGRWKRGYAHPDWESSQSNCNNTDSGHRSFQIFEKSGFTGEVGAALSLTPNGSRVLTGLGFSMERARACKMPQWDTLLGGSLKRVNSVDFSRAEEKYGAFCWSVHRVDLHNELLHLATSEDTAHSKPVKLRLGAQVVDGSSDGSITLKDGSRHTADLIVAADGLHSALRNVVLTDDTKPPSHSGLSAFRFLLDTKVLEDDPQFAPVLEARGPGFALVIDEKDTVNERHMVWYPCRGWVALFSIAIPSPSC